MNTNHEWATPREWAKYIQYGMTYLNNSPCFNLEETINTIRNQAFAAGVASTKTQRITLGKFRVHRKTGKIVELE